MARRARIELPGGVYHIIVRGNERRTVFRDDTDRERYLERLAQYRERFGFQLLAFCLMDNHAHLVIRTGKTPLSRCMHALQSSYTQDFNRRYRRVGHLFQGRYKAFLVDEDRYWLALLRYVHRNPVEAGIVERSDRYRWCSDRAYRTGKGPSWLDVDRGLSYLNGNRPSASRLYRRFMGEVETEVPYEQAPTVGQQVRGDQAFARGVFEAIGGMELVRREVSVERLSDIVARELGQELDFLRSPTRQREASLARAIVGHLGMTYARIPYRRTAEFFRRDGSTLARDVRGLEAALQQTRGMRSVIARITAQL